MLDAERNSWDPIQFSLKWSPFMLEKTGRIEGRSGLCAEGNTNKEKRDST